jgi:uncharacterized protein YkwD
VLTVSRPARAAREQVRRALTAVPALLVAAALLVAGAALAAPAARADSVEDQFTVLLNEERTGQGLPALSPRDDLVAVARSWALTMASGATLGHNPDLTTIVAGWNVVGENVGYGPDASTVHLAFMGSAGHRANILDADYTEVGVGAVVVDGLVWVAEVFRQPALLPTPTPLTTGPVPTTLPDATAGPPPTTPTPAAATTTTSTTTTPRSHSAPTRAFARVLRRGSAGPAVREVQARLGIRTSGFYGKRTARRVSRFQHAHGLPASGVVGRRTWNRLF